MRICLIVCLCAGSIAGAAIAQGSAPSQEPKTAASPPTERQAELEELRAENERLRAWRRGADTLRRYVRTRFVAKTLVEMKPNQVGQALAVRLPADLPVADTVRLEHRAYHEALRKLEAARSSLTEAGGDDTAGRWALDELDRAATEVRAALWSRQDEAAAKTPSELRAENQRLRAEMQDVDGLVRVAEDETVLLLPAQPGPALSLGAGMRFHVRAEEQRGTWRLEPASWSVVVLRADPPVAEPARAEDRAYDAALRGLDAARSSLSEAGDDDRAAHRALDDLCKAAMEVRVALRKKTDAAGAQKK